jgi:GNAT superfamily N-acetyltransferase
MNISVHTLDELDAYARISIAFDVRERVVLPLERTASGDIMTQSLGGSYLKDYDVAPENHPSHWNALLLAARHALLIAERGNEWIGGAIVLCDSPNIHMLRGASDVVLLWDLRVDPRFRGAGVGRALFLSAEHWGIANGCRSIRVETQDTNAAAARFYLRQGCALASATPGAYPDAPGDAQLIFEKELEVA